MARSSTTPLAHKSTTDVVLTGHNDLIDRVNDIDAEGTVYTPTIGVTVQDESSSLATQATTLNFTGAGVAATGTGATKTITIPGAAGGSGNKLGYVVAASNSPTDLKLLADVICDGTADDVDINTIFRTKTSNYTNNVATWVFLLPGVYSISSPVLVPQGGHLIGLGSVADTASLGLGAHLKLANGANCDVIRTSGVLQEPTSVLSWITSWWHWGEIANLFVNGNKANNTWGYGINAGAMGEAACIHNVVVNNCAFEGIRCWGGTPNNLCETSTSGNGRSGIRCSDGDVYKLDNPSGDQNAASLIHLTAASSGNPASFSIRDLKSERTTATTTHDPVILIDHVQGPVTIIGGEANAGSVAAATDLVKRQGAAKDTTYQLWVDATSGSYTLTVVWIDNSSVLQTQTTGSIAVGASTATLTAALEALTGIGSGQVTVVGSANNYEITFSGSAVNGRNVNVRMNSTTSLAGGTTNKIYPGKMVRGNAALAANSMPNVVILGLRHISFSNEYTDTISSGFNQAGPGLNQSGQAYMFACATRGKLLAQGGIGVGNSASATTLGTLSRKVQIFDASGNSLGFVPIYTTIT